MSEYTNYPRLPHVGENELMRFTTPAYRSGEGSSAITYGTDPADEARLLTKVYTKLGVFDRESEVYEAMPEILERRIVDLRESHPGVDLQPLVAARFKQELGLRAVIENFDNGRSVKTYPLGGIWLQYEKDLEMLNRRSIKGVNDPADLEIVGMPLAADNKYGEAGLTLTNMEIEKQRRAIGRGMVANIMDWFALADISRECGKPPHDKVTLDELTFTRFPQMEIIKSADGIDYVGAAYSLGSLAGLFGLRGGRYDYGGVRRLVGRAKS